MAFLPIAAAAFKIGSALANHAAQGKAARANAAAALDAYGLQLGDIAARQQEEQAASAQAVASARKGAFSATSSSKAAAAEAGVAGGSVDALINDIVRAQGEAIDSITQNLEMTQDQLDRQRRGAGATYRARLAGVQSPNIFATGLRIGEAGVGLAQSIVGNKPTTSVKE